MGLPWWWTNPGVTSSAQSAMAAVLGDKDGIVLICGTGSIVLARRGNRTAQVGGYGSFAGDAGSGYWMGRELVRGAGANVWESWADGYVE